jgi:hypothetical protein
MSESSLLEGRGEGQFRRADDEQAIARYFLMSVIFTLTAPFSL